MRAFNKLKTKVAASPRDSIKVGRGRGSMNSVASASSGNLDTTVDEFESMRSFPKLQSIKDCRTENRTALVICKIRLCASMVEFGAFPVPPPGEKSNKIEVKRQTLLELTEFVNSPTSNGILQGDVLQELIAMISRNIYRGLPPKTDNYEPDEDEPILDPSWPHLQIVYELLLRVVVHPEISAKSAKKQHLIDHEFCAKLVLLFDSEDPRERDYLKTILHRVYGKFMSHRAFLRRHIAWVFHKFVYEDHQHNGIGELLEILGSIINGFALPLKEEHIRYLKNSLLPLHKPRIVGVYHPQLAYCIVQFSEKDSNCAAIIVNALVKNWPWSSSTKQLLFLNELEEVLEVIQNGNVNTIKEALFPCLAKCLGSVHFQVAERTLFFWHNEILLKNGFLQDGFAPQLLPVVFPALYESTERGHWNATVSGLSEKVLQIYQDLDITLYDKCLEDYLAKERMQAGDSSRATAWDALEERFPATETISTNDQVDSEE